VVVIGELYTGVVRGLSRVVEDLREVPPVVQRLAPFRGIHGMTMYSCPIVLAASSAAFH